MKKRNLTSLKNSSGLDSSFRKFIQNPQRILKEYVKEGMNVLDIGCGPGLFSFEMAKMVGPNGKVVAADIQKDMLDRLKNKIKGLKIEKRIRIHKCGKNKIGLNEKFDFILVFYVAHEVENKKGFFNGLRKLMKAKTKILIAEPIFHVSKNSFEDTLEEAESLGLRIVKRPKILLSRAALLAKN